MFFPFEMEPKIWIAKNVINIEKAIEKYAVFLLNRQIQFEPTKFLKLWNNASLRVLVDGGGNEWLKYVKTHYTDLSVKKPDYLTGDLDSVTKSAIQQLKALGCETIPTPDQNHTDFTKSLLTMHNILKEQNIKNTVAVLEYGGRIDHILSIINTLYKKEKFFNTLDVYLYTKDSLSWLLSPGSHTIYVPQKYVDDNKWCSFIPLDGKCCVKTSGLKYDVVDDYVAFGDIISSSNAYSLNQIELTCDRSLLWSMETDCEEDLDGNSI